MTEFLEQTRREIQARLTELEPYVEEYERLQAAARALDGVEPSTGAGAPRGGHRPAATGRGRSKGAGTRGNQALELVRAQPGITIPELAERMAIKQNYLYRVLPGLEQDGLVEKRDRGWYPREAA